MCNHREIKEALYWFFPETVMRNDNTVHKQKYIHISSCVRHSLQGDFPLICVSIR
jgi:hypothetical protein